MRWGIIAPEQVLCEEMGRAQPFESLQRRVTFADPLHPDETKSLGLYLDAEGAQVAIGEITPGIYAVGVRRNQGLGSEERS